MRKGLIQPRGGKSRIRGGFAQRTEGVEGEGGDRVPIRVGGVGVFQGAGFYHYGGWRMNMVFDGVNPKAAKVALIR